MNYVRWHIGDYEAATAHLSATEDGLYFRMLRAYYRNEQPLPPDVAKVCRLVRASTKQERAMVEALLGEFFTHADDGFHHNRCDAEILAYQEKAKANRENGKKSCGRPRKPDNPKVTEPEPTKNPDGYFSETQKNLNHKPVANSHKPITQKQRSGMDANSPAVALSAALNAGGIACNSMNPQVILLAEQGVTPAMVPVAIGKAMQHKQGPIPIGYVAKILADDARTSSTKPASATLTAMQKVEDMIRE